MPTPTELRAQAREADPATQAIADLRGDAAVAERLGHAEQAEYLRQMAKRIEAAVEEYITFLAEPDAMLHSGRRREYLRGHFAEWARHGHAFKRGRIRYYRQVVLPRRPSVREAREAGRRGEAYRASA